jgi:5-methylcytosine-specific restriction endonuclease McrA
MMIEQILPRTAREARTIGSLRYNTGRPCSKGHFADKRTANGECWECRTRSNTKYHKENAVILRAKRDEFERMHKEKIKEQRALNYRQNIERERKRNADYNARFPEKRKAVKAVRKRKMKEAKPPWISWGSITRIYKEARERGLTVDHIVPLNNPIVCGLHVPWNLRLIKKEENLSKGNKLMEELL